MRHLVHGKKLNRNTAHRKSMLKNMVFALIAHEQIVTTLPKAKFIKAFAEKIITIGKKYQASIDAERKLFLRRFLISKLGNNNSLFIDKILNTLSHRYKNRSGGYTRIIQYYVRSDSTQMAVIELVERDESEKGAKTYYS